MTDKTMTNKHPDLLIYEAYPRRVGRLGALKAIQKAVAWIVQHDCVDALTARRRLYQVVVAYAKSPAGQNPDRSKIPHPATWFNRGSYLDDPKEWGVVSNGLVLAGKANQNLAVLQRAIDRRKRDGGSNEDGMFSAGGDGRRNARSLHSGSQGS